VQGIWRENERVLGFARESRRGERRFPARFVVVLVAEVISGEHSWCYKQGEPTFEQFMYLYSIQATGKFWLGTGQLPKGEGEGLFHWTQAHNAKVLEEQVVHGLWGLGVSSREESCPAHSYHFQSIGSVKWGPISKEQEDEVEWVRAQLSETERECGNLVTQKNLFESGLLQGMAGIIRGSTKVAVDIDEAEMQKRLRESRAKKAEKSAGKRPRDDDEGRVADVLGKRKAIEEAHQHVMGSGPRLPPFDLQARRSYPSAWRMYCLRGFAAEEGGQPGDAPTGGALGERLLEGVKSDPRLAKTPASSFAFGEMYVSMAKADKEIQRLKRRDQQAKSKVAEAEEAIREKNALLAQKAALAKEVAARTKEVEELKRSKAEEVAAARARRSSPTDPQRS
ncbi:hypothetical protein Prudu_1129S000100, partial [Prunus dulcis]